METTQKTRKTNPMKKHKNHDFCLFSRSLSKCHSVTLSKQKNNQTNPSESVTLSPRPQTSHLNAIRRSSFDYFNKADLLERETAFAKTQSTHRSE